MKTWYLYITRKTLETLEKMEFHDLLKETTEVDFKMLGGGTKTVLVAIVYFYFNLSEFFIFSNTTQQSF